MGMKLVDLVGAAQEIPGADAEVRQQVEIVQRLAERLGVDANSLMHRVDRYLNTVLWPKVCAATFAEQWAMSKGFSIWRGFKSMREHPYAAHVLTLRLGHVVETPLDDDEVAELMRWAADWIQTLGADVRVRDVLLVCVDREYEGELKPPFYRLEDIRRHGLTRSEICGVTGWDRGRLNSELAQARDRLGAARCPSPWRDDH